MSRVENAKARLTPRAGLTTPGQSRATVAEATPPTKQPASTGDQLQSQAVPTAPVTMLDNSGLY